jgi:hypothetical protein
MVFQPLAIFQWCSSPSDSPSMVFEPWKSFNVRALLAVIQWCSSLSDSPSMLFESFWQSFNVVSVLLTVLECCSSPFVSPSMLLAPFCQSTRPWLVKIVSISNSLSLTLQWSFICAISGCSKFKIQLMFEFSLQILFRDSQSKQLLKINEIHYQCWS